MNLRLKIALTLAVLAAPSFAVLSWFRHDLERRFEKERRDERIADFLAERVPRGCVEHPETWRGRRGRRPGPRAPMFAYNASFVSANPRAPKVPVDALDLHGSGKFIEYIPVRKRRDRGLLLKVEASAECYYIGIEFRPPGRVRGFWARHLMTLIIVFGISTVTGLLATWPLVRRITRLTKAMKEASEDHPRVNLESQSRDEIGVMARSFNQLGDRVARNFAKVARRDEVLRAHVANTSHDLAIPLTVIQHRLRRALDRVSSQAEYHGDVMAALEESAYMSSLVRNLNVSTKLEAKDIYFEPTRLDLQDLLRRVESRFFALAKMKEVEFNLATLDDPIWIDADPVLVEQALSNVVQNAVQYAPKNGHVALVVRMRQSGFLVDVLDDGPGIPPSKIDDMLSAGVRDQAVRGRNPEGLGLGLAITRQVCELHHWTLLLQNGDEGGLVVSIAGPLHAADEP